MMPKGASLVLVGVLAATVCLGTILVLSSESARPFATTLLSAKDARVEAARDAKMSQETQTRANQEAASARRDLNLAQKDMRIRQSLLSAAAQQRHSGGMEAERINKNTGEAMMLRERLERLAQDLSGVRQDMAQSNAGFHQSISNTDRILHGVEQLSADARKVGNDDVKMRAHEAEIGKELKQQLNLVHRADIILSKGAAIQSSVEEKAKYADGKARLAIDEDDLLQAKARVLRKSAMILADEAAKKGEKSAQKEADGFAVRQGKMEAEAQNAAKKAQLLEAQAQEADSYVNLLKADMAAAEQKAQGERMKLMNLHREFLEGRELELQGLRKQQVTIVCLCVCVCVCVYSCGGVCV
jgi:hypothetical protein